MSPFGLKHKGYNNQITGRDHQYGYGGKEEQNELGLEWHDFSARNYDASLGRWMNIDPMAGKYLSFSPYNYTLNNPLYFTDPDGREVILAGNRREQRRIFRQLKKLTNDKLKFDRKTGKVSIVKKGVKNKSKNLKQGSSTISNLIKSENSLTIGTIENFKKTNKNSSNSELKKLAKDIEGNNTLTFASEDDQTNGKGGDAFIVFDMNDKGEDIVNQDGTTGRPTFIGLAHELIHGENILGGNVDLYGDYNENLLDPDTGIEGILDPEEENVRLIENDIRKEQGIILRKEPIDNTIKNYEEWLKKQKKGK